MSKKVSVEKQAVFHAYGAKIILCEPTDSFSDPAHYYQVAKKLAEETPNCFFLNQYFNQDNADAHFYGLAPELDSQIGSEITYLFVAMGSAGTANGLARYFKQYRPEVKVIGVDSKNAYYYTNKNPKAYYLDGMGIDYETPFYDPSLFYDVVYVEDAEVHEILKMLAKNHGILVGPSSGGGVAGILRYKDKFNATDCIACLFPDSGRAYLSKNYYN
jgi:cystathionine beta-synthase